MPLTEVHSLVLPAVNILQQEKHLDNQGGGYIFWYRWRNDRKFCIL